MSNFKIKTVFLAVSCGFLLIIVRLFHWQILAYSELSTKALNQQKNRLEIPAHRGEIFTSDNFPLVINKPAYLFFAEPKKIKEDPKFLTEKIAEIVKLENEASRSADEKNESLKKEILEKLSAKNLYWVPLLKKISGEAKSQIANLKIEGLGFRESEVRSYPEASMAAQALGFLGEDLNGRPRGYFGIEGYYDRELAGKSGYLESEKDALGSPIVVGNFKEKPGEPGSDLILTIDHSVQYFIEKYLWEGIQKWGAKGGSALVMNPKNGQIIALASWPGYEPERFEMFDKNLYKNPAANDVYEPGSVVKPLIMAAAINENLINPETKCSLCGGPREIDGYLIHTFNDQYHPNLTITEILENSDNTGMVFVGDKLGKDKLFQYLKSYGFGERTGIDLEDEETGYLRNKYEWSEIDKATLTFGQGMGTTALQVARAFSTLANGGNLIKPQLVEKIVSGERTFPLKNESQGRVLKKSTTLLVTEMLVNVSLKSPLHFVLERMPELKNYRISAKSGTAQIAIAGHYDEKRTVASVIGYAPADNPKFLVLVKLNEPSVRPWGSDTAGPVFFNIIRDLLIYYNIPPE